MSHSYWYENNDEKKFTSFDYDEHYNNSLYGAMHHNPYNFSTVQSGNHITTSYQENHISDYDEKRLLYELSKSKKTKSEVLDLDNIMIVRLPDELKEFHWVKILHVKNTGLISFDNLPPNVSEISADSNKIESIDIKSYTIKELSLVNNKIKTIKSLPNTIEKIDLDNNYLNDNSFRDVIFPDTLEYLVLDNNLLEKIPILNHNLNTLSIRHNHLKSLTGMPKYISSIDFSHNMIDRIIDWPQYVKKVVGTHNFIKIIRDIPLSVEYLDMERNELKFVPILHSNMKFADFSSNNISVFLARYIPEKLERLNLKNNILANIPQLFADDERVIYDKRMSLHTYSRETETHSIYAVSNPNYIVLTKHKVI